MFLSFPMGLVCSKASLVQFDRFSGSSSSHKACSMTFCISKRMSAVCHPASVGKELELTLAEGDDELLVATHFLISIV